MILAAAARAMAAADPDRVIMVAGDQRLLAAGVVVKAERLAAGLRHRGLRAGDVASLVLPNRPEAMTINLACAMAGLVVNPIVPIYREAELRHILADCRSRIVFIAGQVRSIDYAQVLRTIRDDLPHLDHVVDLSGGDLDSVRADGDALVPDAQPGPDAVKLIMYTSGTTGPAKGVLHTHTSLASVIATGAANWGLPPAPTMLIATPIGHVTGFLWGLEAPFLVGTRVILQERWDPDEAVRLIERHKVDLTTGAAPFLQDSVAAARRASTGLPSLKLFGCGGAAVTPALIRSARETFTNAVAYRVYGSTEAPNITQGYTDPADADASADTDGRPTEYEVRITGPDGRPVPPGQEGEIRARGPAMFHGYTDPALDAEALDAEGFFMTGDLGWQRPDGAIVISGRRKDLIIRGGENLSPKEIEDVLAGHPGVGEVAVVGMPHPRMGEAVCAFVVPGRADTPSLPDLASWIVRAGLARQKTPERLEIVAELPRTASGKVRKDVLRRMAVALVQGASS